MLVRFNSRFLLDNCPLEVLISLRFSVQILCLSMLVNMDRILYVEIGKFGLQLTIALLVL